MPTQEILFLAITKMHGGLCIAGMSTEVDPVTGRRWVRPTREFGHVVPGDIATSGGAMLQTFDVARLELVRARPDPPHREDWIADFRRAPRILRRLEGEGRAAFLATHLDEQPEDVLERQSRSLCLVRPDWIRGRFWLDAHSGAFDARLAFGLGRLTCEGSREKGGVAATDLKWRALGRKWLSAGVGMLEFDGQELKARLGIRDLFLVVGLSRKFEGRCWPMVVGVHTVPDYEASIDYSRGSEDAL